MSTKKQAPVIPPPGPDRDRAVAEVLGGEWYEAVLDGDVLVCLPGEHGSHIHFQSLSINGDEAVPLVDFLRMRQSEIERWTFAIGLLDDGQTSVSARPPHGLQQLEIAPPTLADALTEAILRALESKEIP